MNIEKRAVAGAAVAAMLLAPVAGSASQLVLTTCGRVPAQVTAVLAGDLSCAYHCASDETKPCDLADPDASCGRLQDSCEPDTIALGAGAQLRLNGHTIHPAYQGDGVVCGEPGERGTCSVFGPGRIAGEKGIGVFGRSMNVVLRNLTIDGSDAAVITDGKLMASYLQLGEDRENGLSAGGTMFLRNVSLGVDGAHVPGNIFVSNVIVRGRIEAGGDVRGSGVRLVRKGITAKNVILSDVFGAYTPGQDGPGSVVARERLRLTRSSVTGNEVYDGVPDLVSGRRPELVRTRCDNSARYDDRSVSWNVCRDD